ncbi:PKD domain-containing protein [Pseudoalteromonas sp. MMG005]|uniref:PKD domain-containing protein n=1 Tax=Pseudoalteromonas sp. MMG005 TaxID=2822682 RepID=UPI001B3A5695|nr:PKD domain-containing protein [Pseudoalteromonas sp. MMG005]MBQ4848287.1 PKD domain-containing protein [Pseudoalteromonas sp. MMG005]
MKGNKFKTKLTTAFVVTLVSSSASAHKFLIDPACNVNKKWRNQSSMTFNANPTGFAGAFAKWKTSFQQAMNRVNDTPANFTIYVRTDDDNSVGTNNGESEIWWSTGTSAVAYTITNSCGNTVETDIVFHNNIPNGGYNDKMDEKTSYRGYGLERRLFETTAIHEIGHTLGLAHENRYYNIMGTDYTHVHTSGENSLRSYVGEDAANGLITLYGSSTRQDVSVSAWRRTGSSGEYSSHGRNRLLDSNGTELSSTKVESSCTRDYCEMRHNVDLGQQVQMELTLENSGSHAQNVQLGYYISTNATITNTDTLITTDTVSVSRRVPDEVKKSIVIPNNLQPNTNYYLGVIIDNANQVSEWDEQNNTSYIHIRTGSGSSNSAPIAEANGPYSAVTNAVINFSSANSYDSDGNIASYSWDFGDGSAPSSSANPSYRYTTAGTYTATLTVTDNQGAIASDAATVTITGSPTGGRIDNACATAGPTTGSSLTSGNTICLPNGSRDADIQYYFIYVPAGISTLTIETDHGTGDGDVYYKASTWATISNYDQRGFSDNNTELVSVNNPAQGYRFISVVGQRTGMAMKVTLE